MELKPIKNNASRAKAFLVFTYINLAIGLAMLLHSFYIKSKSDEINQNIKQLTYKLYIAQNEWLASNANLSFFMSIMTFVAFLVFIAWSYRAYKNVSINSDYTAYNPSWAIWCYFVPILNFIRPQQVMNDIIKRNTKLMQTIDSKHNYKFPLSIISFWWLLYIAYYISNQLSLSITKDSYIYDTTAYDMSTVGICKSLFFILVAIIQIKMVLYVKGIESKIFEINKQGDETKADDAPKDN